MHERVRSLSVSKRRPRTTSMGRRLSLTTNRKMYVKTEMSFSFPSSSTYSAIGLSTWCVFLSSFFLSSAFALTNFRHAYRWKVAWERWRKFFSSHFPSQLVVTWTRFRCCPEFVRFILYAKVESEVIAVDNWSQRLVRAQQSCWSYRMWKENRVEIWGFNWGSKLPRLFQALDSIELFSQVFSRSQIRKVSQKCP